MKKKKWTILLIIEALLCVSAVLLGQKMTHIFSAAVCAPFEQIAWGLRILSLSGSAGNVLSVMLYGLLGAAPLLWFILRFAANRAKREDGLLILLSAGVFAALYLLINPGLMGVYNHAVGKSALCGAVHSITAAYAVLRLLRAVRGAQRQQICRISRVLLFLLSLVLCAAAFGGGVSGAMSELRALHEGNTDRSHLGVSYLMLVLRSCVNGLPLLLDIWVIFAACDLVDAFEREEDAASVQAADALQKRCRVSLAWVVVSGMAFNVLQLVLSPLARQVHVTLLLPLESMMLLSTALIVGYLVRDMKRIRDENESFI